ncbi:PTS sugar transporter [Microbacterium protaetiae]|uniref:PTS sugar transporter n=1 Tax=Microbacterium protaetiae TaxID=2509458 RepID=A0A4V0YDG0_9MICO|nr:PTS sugar transporter [Microbacterium protaetiae]QAY60581.1 PTS sugar transporter [Microbacterium protaetiae]
MRITVMCGAGASSTFVAQRLRGAIAARGLTDTAHAAGLSSYPDCLESTDVLLVGPHLVDRLDDVRRDAAARGIAVAMLPDDIFGDRDGERAFALATASGSASAGTRPTFVPASDDVAPDDISTDDERNMS